RPSPGSCTTDHGRRAKSRGLRCAGRLQEVTSRAQPPSTVQSAIGLSSVARPSSPHPFRPRGGTRCAAAIARASSPTTRRRRPPPRLRADVHPPPPPLARLRDAQAQDEPAAHLLLDPGRGVPLPLADPARLARGEADHHLGRARPLLDPERLRRVLPEVE